MNYFHLETSNSMWNHRLNRQNSLIVLKFECFERFSNETNLSNSIDFIFIRLVLPNWFDWNYYSKWCLCKCIFVLKDLDSEENRSLNYFRTLSTLVLMELNDLTFDRYSIEFFFSFLKKIVIFLSRTTNAIFSSIEIFSSIVWQEFFFEIEKWRVHSIETMDKMKFSAFLYWIIRSNSNLHRWV